MGDESTKRVSIEANDQSSSSSSNKLPNFLLSIRLKYVKLGYHYLITHAMYLCLVPILVALSVHLSTITMEDVF